MPLTYYVEIHMLDRRGNRTAIVGKRDFIDMREALTYIRERVKHLRALRLSVSAKTDGTLQETADFYELSKEAANI